MTKQEKPIKTEFLLKSFICKINLGEGRILGQGRNKAMSKVTVNVCVVVCVCGCIWLRRGAAYRINSLICMVLDDIQAQQVNIKDLKNRKTYTSLLVRHDQRPIFFAHGTKLKTICGVACDKSHTHLKQKNSPYIFI